MRNKGKFTIILRNEQTGNDDYEVNCNHFYAKDGFLVIDHKDGDLEYYPLNRVMFILKTKENRKASIDESLKV